MEFWKVFTLNGKELCAYTLFGESDDEEMDTLSLLAFENGCSINDIEVTIIKR